MTNENTVNILCNTSYILSGPPCSGKSTFLKSLIEKGVAPSAIVSPDEIRKQILGYKHFVDDNGSAKSLYGWYYEGDVVFSIVESVIKARLNQGLPVFVDATNLTDTERGGYAKIFYDYRRNFEVLIFDTPVEELINRLKVRDFRFQEDKDMKSVVERHEKTSQFPYHTITTNTQINYITALTSNLDFVVVGDTHGLIEPLKELLEKDGFIFEDKQFKHPEGKKVLFLGDVVCRGKNSLELLNVVKNTIQAGNGWMLKGNHEVQLIRAIDSLEFRGVLDNSMSLSTTQTLKEYCKKNPEERLEIFTFMRNLPYSLSFIVNKETLKGENWSKNDDSQFKIAFGHSPLNYYNPSTTPGEELAYNQVPWSFDVHQSYEQNFLMGHNEYVYIHARQPNGDKFKASATYSIADLESFDGNLVSFNLREYISAAKGNNFQLTPELFEKAIKKQPTHFNFVEQNKVAIGLRNGLSVLSKNNFFDKPEKGEKHTNSLGLKMYVKKDRKCHPTNTLLEKCNGLVVDNAGSIIVNPRPILKSGIHLKDNDLVYAINHTSDSILYIFKDPYTNQISSTSSRSFETYEEDKIFIKKNEQRFKEFFSKNNATLGFESRLVDDNKAIDFVLTYGQRNSLKSTPFSEETLDEIANEIQVTRPIFKATNMADVREKCSYTTGLGYIVRKIGQDDELHFVPSDLVMFHKLHSCLNDEGNIKFFYNKPEIFAERFLSEDLNDVAKRIQKSFKMDEFIKLNPEERRRAIFESMHADEKNETPLKIKK